MNPALVSLIAATIAFVGTHFALSHPLREPMVRMVGPRGFQAIFSLIAFVTLGWMVLAFRAVPNDFFWDGRWNGVATGITLIASVLLAGSLIGNPALPTPHAAELATRQPHGVFHVTRHPMMWAFALWSVSHALIVPTARTLVLTGGIAVLALVGAHLQDRKKQAAMGAAWHGWAARTTYWPRTSGLLRAGALPWAGGLAIWLAASWAHGPLAAMPVGIWRWV